MREPGNAAMAGRVGRFSAPNKVFGWVLVHEVEKPVTILVTYRGEKVGAGFADQPKNSIEQGTGRKRFGFVVKLTREFSDTEACSDDFQIYAETGAVSCLLKKSAQFGSEATTSRIQPPAGDDVQPSAAQELSEISVEVGTKSSDGSVVIGRKGFLFLIGGSNKVDQLYQLADDGVSGQWCNLVRSRAALCERMGVAYLQVFIPEKQSVLSGYFGSLLNAPTPPYKNIKNAIYRDSTLVSRTLFFEDLLSDDLSAEKSFKKTDSHLTSEGARALFDRQLQMLTGKSGLYEMTGSHEFVKTWDLGIKFTTIKILEQATVFAGLTVNNIEMTPTVVSEELPASGNRGTRRVYMNEQAPIRKKVIAFANSFYWQGGSSLGQCWWYSRLFSEFHFVWSPEMRHDYIKENRPDIVVCQTIERFLRRVPSS